MKILLCQSDLVWEGREDNYIAIERQIEAESRSVDLIVLPEMFPTGFCTEPNGVAEAPDGPSLHWMKKIALQREAAVVGSVATNDNGDYYNRLYFVYPDGTYLKYDKHHLFTYGGEHLRYSPGNERVVAEYRGWRFLLQVCYDLRFPVFARNCNDYHAVIYIASWPTVRLYAWNTLLRARAIENLSYVIGVNRVGNDPNCAYSGGTMVADYMGTVISEASPNTVSTLLVELDMDKLKQFREKFPALNDRDNFELK